MKTEGDRITEQNKAFDIAESMTDDMQREAFERWAKALKGSPIPLDVSEFHFVNYLDDVTAIAWTAWQAAIRHMREQKDKA